MHYSQLWLLIMQIFGHMNFDYVDISHRFPVRFLHHSLPGPSKPTGPPSYKSFVLCNFTNVNTFQAGFLYHALLFPSTHSKCCLPVLFKADTKRQPFPSTQLCDLLLVAIYFQSAI